MLFTGSEQSVARALAPMDLRTGGETCQVKHRIVFSGKCRVALAMASNIINRQILAMSEQPITAIWAYMGELSALGLLDREAKAQEAFAHALHGMP